jgi:Tol biopolymer transport system component/DNA-binding winged helix-turn-helix (wHTH) protein
MSGENVQYYDFVNFRLDAAEKVLLRDGTRVQITPKVYDTLKVFVENPARLLTKADLMEMLWRDNFVEESNLTSNIKMLRKALGDDAANPQFIETVQRRGYRFIADVRETSNEIAARSIHSLEAAPSSGRRSYRFVVTAIVMLAAVIGFSAYWIAKSATPVGAAPILSAPFSSEKLSTNGSVLQAVVSPDGRKVVYTNGHEGPQSVWLRELETSTNIEIIPPSDDFYYGLALSPDGNFLYFARSPRQRREMGIYRVSIFGGVPAKIITGSEGWLSVSPDGSTISFVRCPYTEEEYCSLWTADAVSGKNERKLATRPNPIRIADNEFSPDGKTLVFAVGQSLNGGKDFGISNIDLASGSESEMTSEKFFNIKSLEWLPDGSALLITAARMPNKQFRIWEIAAQSGAARPLTDGPESYNRLSLNRDANVLIATQSRQDYRLSVANTDELAVRRPLVDASAVSFAQNGTLLFASVSTGNDEIWSINPNGTGQRQLTNDPADETAPIASSDGKSVFFASNRTEVAQVWRMNADGSEQTQLTFKSGGQPIFVSGDGKWVYYRHGVEKTLWRVPAAGGEEELVLNKRAMSFAVSPDGGQAAYSEITQGERLIGIVSLSDGKILRTFNVSNQETSPMEIVWMPDGKSVVYVLLAGDSNVLMLQPVDGAPGTKLADLGAEQINGFAVAPDGKSFAIVQGGWRHDAYLIQGLRR